MRAAPRVAILGARRSRQGLGPFVARALVAAGAEVPAILGTSPATVAAARDELQRLLGIAPAGFVDPAALLAAGPLDAVAILTPAETHRHWLTWALESRLAVLCEKPLLWGGADDLAACDELASAFAAAKLPLWENCQWPCTLGAYLELHPGARGVRPRRFAMRLSPAVTGGRMIGDSLPHSLSLLQTIAPGAEARVQDVRFSSHADEASELAVDFTWVADGQPLAVRVELAREDRQPRTAGYALDGLWAWRAVRARDYAQFFVAGPRMVDVPDPLAALVADFVASLRTGRSAARAGDWPTDPLAPDRRIVQRMAALTELLRVWRQGTT